MTTLRLSALAALLWIAACGGGRDDGGGGTVDACVAPFTTDDHCGACGNACAPGTTCVAAACAPTAASACGGELGLPGAPLLETGLGPRAVALGDLDGDGVLDLVVALRAADAIAVYLGATTGWGPATTYSTFAVNPGKPVSVSLGDLDGDGDLDVVTANRGTSKIGIFLNDGTGLLDAQFTVDVGSAPLHVTTGDLDGQGGADVAVATLGTGIADSGGVPGGVRVLRAFDGVAKTFGASAFHATGPSSSRFAASAVAIADLDGDGRNDLAASNLWHVTYLGGGYDETYAAVFLQLPAPAAAGSFGTPQGFSVDYSSQYDVAAGDVDGDGDADLVLRTGAGMGAVTTLLNTTPTGGPFGMTEGPTSGTGRATFELEGGYGGLALGDLDGDGDLDAATVDGLDGTVSVLVNDGTGTLAPPFQLAAGDGPGDLAAADLDGDGRSDLVVPTLSAGSSLVSGVIHLLHGSASGPLGARAWHTPGDTLALGVALGDLDGDGLDDAVVTSSPSAWWKGDGAGTFAAGGSLARNTVDAGVAVGDFDDDGDADVLAPLGGGKVGLFANDGVGGFAAPIEIAARTGVQGIAAGDFDGDGRLDFVDVAYGSASIDVYVQAAGGFTKLASARLQGIPGSVGMLSPNGIAVADLNADGRLDLAVAHGSGVGILHGDGAGGFTYKQGLPAGAEARGIAVADLDGDLRPDLAVANGGVRTVSLFWNGGSSFGAQAVVPIGPAPIPGEYVELKQIGMAAADLDGDGRPDLAATDYGRGLVAVLRNHGGRSFGPYATYAAGDGAAAMATADLDGDGRPELVVSSELAHGFAVFRPSCLP
jgi:hypothetical protein